MLVELRVQDLGVIESVTLDLHGGMTALTGETGAGKTLLVEALGLKPQDNPADLASRVSALGVTFAQEVRVVTIVDSTRRAKRASPSASVAERLYVLFDDRSFAVLVTEREDDTVVLVQGPQARIAESLEPTST